MTDNQDSKPELTEKELEQISGGMRPSADGGTTATTHISDQTATTDSDTTSD